MILITRVTLGLGSSNMSQMGTYTCTTERKTVASGRDTHVVSSNLAKYSAII